MKDWTGNENSIFKMLGSSNHSNKERENNDYYATEPKAASLLLENEVLSNVWECAAGECHLADVFEKHGCLKRKSDLIVRRNDVEQYDFLSFNDLFTSVCNNLYDGDIVTNPPYKYAIEFVYSALKRVSYGRKVCMFLKLQFLEGKKRKNLFKQYPPKVIYVSSSRLLCAKNGDFETMIKDGGSAVAYAWFVWEKGYVGDTVVKWIN